MSGVGKRREGICPGWENDGREYVRGGKTTGGNMSGVGKRREGICPRGNWSEREYVREGAYPKAADLQPDRSHYDVKVIPPCQPYYHYNIN